MQVHSKRRRKRTRLLKVREGATKANLRSEALHDRKDLDQASAPAARNWNGAPISVGLEFNSHKSTAGLVAWEELNLLLSRLERRTCFVRKRNGWPTKAQEANKGCLRIFSDWSPQLDFDGTLRGSRALAVVNRPMATNALTNVVHDLEKSPVAHKEAALA